LTAFWDLAQLKGMETPWRKLSRILGGGMRNGEYYVLGGNQGSGKTSLALQFIIAALRRAEGVLLFSMEMNWRDVYQRMAAMEAHVDLNEFREYQFILRRKDSCEQDRFAAQRSLGPMLVEVCRHTAEFMEMPILVHTKSSVTPDYIIQETTRLAKRIRTKLVVVDHMQLMGSDGGERGDYDKFTAISRVMKTVAKELDVPVLVVSQTNRAQAKEHRQEIEVADLRGSGAIEEDAAAVMLLFEDHEDKIAAINEPGDRYTKGPVKCILKVGKNRYGQQGGRTVYFNHHKTTTQFELCED
jgi:replicative DNA helicase